MFFYQAYGLNIRSELKLPELITGGTGQDLSIEIGKLNLPDNLERTKIKRQNIELLYGGSAKAAYLRWQGIATLCARGSNTLIVDRDFKQINRQRLNLYILSEALGLILYQRGLFLLHASAIKIGDRAVVFAGMPGAGKSTTAAAFARAGHTVLADDLVAIDLSDSGQPLVYPAFPQLKIWAATAKGLGYDFSSLPKLFPRSHKRVIRDRDGFSLQPLPLSAIYFLESAEDLKLELIQDTKAFMLLARFFPLPSSILQASELETHFRQCMQLINRVELWKISNPQTFATLNNLIALISPHSSNLKLV